MKALALLLISAFSSVASAQGTAVVSVHWKNTGSSTTSPTQIPLDGVNYLSADVWIDVSFSPAVGQPLGTGLAAGLASIFFDLQAGAAAAGSWAFTGNFNGTPAIDGPGSNMNWASYGRRLDSVGGWALASEGSGASDGSLRSAQAGQFPSGPPVNAFNPVREIWRGVYTPDSYLPRMVTFTSQKPMAGTTTSGIQLFTLDGSTLGSYPLPIGSITWGSVQIPVVPAPPTFALLGMTALAAVRRRRQAASATGRNVSARPGSAVY
jgi:hypothetical protein